MRSVLIIAILVVGLLVAGLVWSSVVGHGNGPQTIHNPYVEP